MHITLSLPQIGPPVELDVPSDFAAKEMPWLRPSRDTLAF
jgi:hypothetical protein